MNQRTRRAGNPSKANEHPERPVERPDFLLRPTIAGMAFVVVAATVPALNAQTTSSGSVVGAGGRGADLTIGDAAGSSGAMSVKGRSTEFYAGHLQSGVSGTGRLDIGEGAYFRVENTSVVGMNSGGVGIVTVDGQNTLLAQDDSMHVGDAGSGSVVVSNGARLSLDSSPSTEPDLDIGIQAGTPGSAGSMTVTGASVAGNASALAVANNAQVGVSGIGRLEVSEGAQASVSRDLTVGAQAGSDGTLLVTRLAATLGVGTTTTIGDSGTGKASVIGGGRLTTGDLRIGRRAEGNGDVTVSGTASRLSASGALVVGGEGIGKLSILGGSPVEAASVDVAQSKGSVGSVLVDGRSDSSRYQLASDGLVRVADSGSGSMVVSRGARVNAKQAIVVGNAAGSVGELTVTGTGSQIGTDGDVQLGKAGTASLSVDKGGRLAAAGDASLGIDAGSRSHVSVDGAGSAMSVGGKLSVGESGSGEMRIVGGGTVVAQAVSVGNDPAGAGGDGSGSVTVDGTGSTLTVDGSTVVGDAGRGLVVVSGGGALTMRGGRLQIGERAGASGGVSVTGRNSTLDLDRGVRVGDRGTGRLEVSDGAQASTSSNVEVGVEQGATGTLVVTGPVSRLSVESITVGHAGTGGATVSAGGTLATLDLSVGFRDTASGSVTVDGENSLLAVQGSLTLGQDGNASLLVSDAARATVGEDAVIGVDRGTGAMTVTGAKSRLKVAEDLIVGQGTSGALSVLDGAGGEARYLCVGREAGGSGVVTVAGAGSRLMLDFLTVADAGTGSVTVSGGGDLTVDSTELSTVVGARAGGRGSVLVTGPGARFGTAADIRVGDFGTGSMRVADGAQAFVGLDASVGTHAGSDGTVAVTGASSTLVVQGTTTIGDSGVGRATVSDGGALTTSGLSVGEAGSGNVAVEGAGSTLSVASRTVVGGAGVGGLSVLDGARADAKHVVVGRDAGGSGRVEVTGTGSRLTLDILTVAEAGTGTVDVSGGGGLAVNSTEVPMVVGARPGVQGGVLVTGAGSTLDVATDVAVGRSGTGVLRLTDGGRGFVGASAVVGQEAGSTGTLAVGGTSSKLSVVGATTVGDAGAATAAVQGGGTLATGDLVVGKFASGVGNVKVDGAGSRLAVDRGLELGRGGKGTLTIAASAQATAGGDVVLGTDAGSTGAVSVSGTGSGLTSGGQVRIAASGSGTMSVSDGARASVALDARIGANAGADGSLGVSGRSSSLVVAGTTFVGDAGLGTATVSDAATLATGGLSVGRAAGAQGRMTVDGPGSTLAVKGELQVGRAGSGTLTVSNGAQATSSVTDLGPNAGGTATVRLAGVGSALTTGDVYLGRNDPSDAAGTNGGTASLGVTDGAVLHAVGIHVASSAGSTATLDIGADARGSAAAPGTIDARRIAFGRGDGTLVLNHTARDYAFTPTIEGAGRVQALSGTTTLASGSTYTGGTSISGATLRGSATSFGSGAIRNDGALVIDQASDAAFANAMAGTGALTKTGAGLLDVTGDSSGFSGPTTIAGGRLAVDGSLVRSVVTAQSGTTLSGAGTVGGVLARTGSTVAPGNSPGTLTVAGDYHQAAGATYATEVVPGSSVSDQLAVGGTATLDSGAVIHVSKYGTGGYVPGTRYTVMSAAGGVKGTYVLTGETDVSAFYSLGTTYDADHVYLDTVQARPFVAAAGTINQTAAASGVQGLPLAKGLPTAVGSLRTDADARRAFDQLSGELHASAGTVLLEDSRFVREATTRQVHASGDGLGTTIGKGSGESVWAHAYGASGRHDGDGNAAGLKRDIGGLFVGTDAVVAGDTRLGVVGGYGRSRIELKEGRGSATVDSYSVGLYGATQWDRTRASFGANGAWHKLATSRSVGLEGFADSLSADYHARTTQLYGDVGYRMGAELGPDSAPAALEPFASLAWVDLRTSGGVQEKGGAAALGVAGSSTRVGFATLGMRSAATLDVAGVPVVASGLLGWRGVLGGTTPSSTNGFAGGAGFVVRGVPLARNVAALEANVSAALTPTLTLGLAYAGQIGSRFSDHGIRASLSMKF